MKETSALSFWSGLCLLMLSVGVILILNTGPAPQLSYSSDVAGYLDATYRAALGQTLGQDYASPIGPAAILATVVAMRCGAWTVEALSIGAAFVWLAYGTLSWLVVRSRMAPWLAWSFTLFIAAVAAAPYTLDFGSWRILSYGMLYNRLAWATLGILAALAILKPHPAHKKTSESVAAAIGIAAAWLWAIKPNYLLILAPLALIAWLNAENRRISVWILWALSGSVITLVLIWGCVHFDPIGYAKEHFAMARGAPAGLMLYTLRRSLAENAVPVTALIVAVTLFRFPARPFSLGLRNPVLWQCLALGSLVPATFIANVTNCQFSEIPFWGALGWIIAAQVPAVVRPTLISRGGMILGLVVGICYTWQPVASFSYSWLWNRSRSVRDDRSLRVNSGAWQAMPMRFLPGEPTSILELGTNPSAGVYAAWLNDGLALFERHRVKNPSILCVDWINPFPFATATPPLLHDQIAWHVGRTIGQQHHPDLARLCDAANIVMEPKSSIQLESLNFKRALFRVYLQDTFVVAGESEAWRIWIKRGTTKLPSHSPSADNPSTSFNNLSDEFASQVSRSEVDSGLPLVK